MRQCVEKMNEQLYQARRRCAPPLLRYLQKKTEGGAGINPPPPGCARVNIIDFYQVMPIELDTTWLSLSCPARILLTVSCLVCSLLVFSYPAVPFLDNGHFHSVVILFLA